MKSKRGKRMTDEEVKNKKRTKKELKFYVNKLANKFIKRNHILECYDGSVAKIIKKAYISAYFICIHHCNTEIKHKQQWHKIFVENTPYNYEYWDLPQETLPKIENFYFVKLKNGFIKICELKYDVHSKKKYFYDLHGWTQSDVAEWLDYPKE